MSNDGNSSAKYINDNRGNVQEMWFYGLDGKLNEINEGYAGVKLNYDSIGNIIEYVTYGIDQKPCLKSDGTAGYKACLLYTSQGSLLCTDVGGYGTTD